jgi:hypothetical protein
MFCMLLQGEDSPQEEVGPEMLRALLQDFVEQLNPLRNTPKTSVPRVNYCADCWGLQHRNRGLGRPLFTVTPHLANRLPTSRPRQFPRLRQFALGIALPS